MKLEVAMLDETTLLARERASGTLSTNRLRGLLDIVAACVPLLVLGSAGTWLGAGTLLGGLLITLAYGLTVLVAGGILKSRGSGWREIGLAQPKSWHRTVLLGIGAAVGAVLVSVAVTAIVLNLPRFAAEPADVSRFNPMEGNVALFLGYIVLAWTAIAFGEEMFFRAFLTDRLANLFQYTKVGWAFGLIGSSIAFGLVHLQEGPVGMLSTGAFGLLWAWIYLRAGRNLWVTVIAHGLLNTLRFALVFAGAA
jgi:membrane protease YdiL (CAAX protease family)